MKEIFLLLFICLSERGNEDIYFGNSSVAVGKEGKGLEIFDTATCYL
jgi:hypothetical protein